MADEPKLEMIERDEVAAANGRGVSTNDSLEHTDSYVGVPMTPFVLEYLKSDKGHQLASRTLELLEGVKKATLDEQAKAKAQQNELAKLALKHTVLIQTIGLFAVVGAIVGLSAAGQLRGEAATILGAMAGYLFAQQKKAGS